MKYLRKIFEDKKNLLTEEDVSDYLLEFIDNGTIKYEKIVIDKNSNSPDSVSLIYSIDPNLKSISNDEDMMRYSKLTSGIVSISKRWGLKYELSNFNTYLGIIQSIPDGIMEISNAIYDSPWHYIHISKYEYSFQASFNVSDDLIFSISLMYDDDNEWDFGEIDDDIEREIIKQTETNFLRKLCNSNIKCEFIESEVSSEGNTFFIFQLIV